MRDNVFSTILNTNLNIVYAMYIQYAWSELRWRSGASICLQ